VLYRLEHPHLETSLWIQSETKNRHGDRKLNFSFVIVTTNFFISIILSDILTAKLNCAFIEVKQYQFLIKF